MPTNPVQQPDVRHPRGIVQLNGLETNWTSIEITSKNFYLSDTARIEIPLYENKNEIDFAYWSTVNDIFIEIFAGFPDDPDSYSISNLDSVFSGKVDTIDIDPSRGLVVITSRDLSSILIDKKTTEYFPAKTASEIITKFATENNLTPVVTATTDDVGIYKKQFSKITRQRSLWDICTFLADKEDFNVFVLGTELHFEPKPKDTQNPYLVTFNRRDFGNSVTSGDFLTVNFSRSLTLARDVIVNVRSFNDKTRKAFKIRAASQHTKALVTRGAKRFPKPEQVYVFDVPNLSREQAVKLAQKKLLDITEHELLLEIDLPADNILKKTDIIKITGTDTDFDQIYFINTIDRKMEVGEGYSMHITAKNHDTNTEVTL